MCVCVCVCVCVRAVCVCVCVCRMIFLGETFSGFVTAHNDSQDLVKEVVLKVRLGFQCDRPQF